jgi:hydroxyacylglutathione hydrolase
MALSVEAFSVGEYSTNCYVLRAAEGSPEAVVIDPGADAIELRFELGRLRTRCAAILITHGHHDHIGGVADLAEATGALVYMAAGERDRLERSASTMGPPVRAYTPDRLLEGGETFDAAGIVFECVSVPGHSPAHLAYVADGCLFSGDLLFAGAVGTWTIPGADLPTLLDSIGTLSRRYAPDTVVYPGHGPATTLGDELADNPFLETLRA